MTLFVQALNRLTAMKKPYLGEIRKTYSRGASWYNWYAAALSLGQEKLIRREFIGKMGLRPGDTVLEVACGTGLNFEALQHFIGPAGRIIGVDYTDEMLVQARARIKRHRWNNVLLLRGEASQLPLGDLVDGALCTFAIGLMPQPKRVLDQTHELLRPGHTLLIADGRLSGHWYGSLINPVLHLAALPWLPPYSRNLYFAARPWEDLKELLGKISYEELFGGTIYVAWGKKE